MRWRTCRNRQKARERYGRHVLTKRNFKTWAQRGATWQEICVDIEAMLSHTLAIGGRQLRPEDPRCKKLWPATP